MGTDWLIGLVRFRILKPMSDDQNIGGYAALGEDINKKKTLGADTLEKKEGVASEKLPELTLDMEDKDLLALTEKWEKIWNDSAKKAEWEKQINEAERYWRGNQSDMPKAVNERPLVDNLIFESLETYLPQMTRRNPEPLVELRADEESDQVKEKYILKVKNTLADLADSLKVRLKLKKAGRHWAIYQLGVAKYGYDLDNERPSVRIIRPRKLILDPEAVTDEDGYTGNRVGEYRKLEAGIIKAIAGDDLSEEGKKCIDEETGGNDATEIQFVEWWTPQYFCWKLKKNILLKKKNPHWNYDSDEQVENVDSYGNKTQGTEQRKGINHFVVPKLPYSFLSVFNLGDQPMDNTSLIAQNLPIQDAINRRNKQIDDNVRDMNGGIVISLGKSGLSEPQAKNVVKTLRNKGAVAIPEGLPEEAIYKFTPSQLPADVYNDMYDKRARLRDLFGVKGSSQAGLENENTVRGKIVSRMLDTDRIGGGVSEYLEQFADEIYNWIVQLLYVYDPNFQFIAGAEPPKIKVSVKEGSLLPKDSISLANQAIELAIAGKMSLLDLYKKLEYANPEELAANVWLEFNAPHLLYKDDPRIQEFMGIQQQQGMEEQAASEANAEQSHQRNLEMIAAKRPPVPVVRPQTEPQPEQVASQGL